MTATRYVVVNTSHAREIPAYLYSHTEIVATATTEQPWGNREHFLLVTTADDEDRAAYLANYQANRLLSGMHNANTFATREAAEKYLLDAMGVTVTDVEA